MRFRVLVSSILAGVFLCSSAAHAGFLIEPYLGYVLSGDTKNAGSTDDLSGTALGLRIGSTTLGFMYGLQYEIGSISIESSAGGSDTDFDATNLSLFFGFEFPILVRAWLTYDISAKGSTSGAGITNDFTGSGYVLGAGYTGFPFVSVNFEIFNRTYDECDSNFAANCRAVVMGDDDIVSSGYMLSVSLPLP